MNDKRVVWLTRFNWLVGIVFFVTVVLPLTVERFAAGDDWKSQFLSFQLKDESGQRHVGFLSLAKILYDAEFMEYGYEAPKGMDLSKWQQKIIGMPRKDVKETDGFIWTDKGFLWADYKTLNEVTLQEGQRLGKLPAPTDQLELTQPGAALDIASPTTSYLGKFPNYVVKYEDKNFKFDLQTKARTPAWYMYNEGRPFRAGDFGIGSMNELALEIGGDITHKQTGKVYKVAGTGLFEDAIGIPWSWIEWGAHDWLDLHHANGWSGSLWKAQDDWQWGYHPDPHTGWLWDPELKKFHTFHRAELVSAEYAKEPVSGLTYPAKARWLAYGTDATLEVETTNLTMKPRETIFPPIGFSLKMSYGNHTTKARLMRRNGEVVDLGYGIATMEHFENVIPDYAIWGPLMLALMVLGWGARSMAIARAGGQTVLGRATLTLFGLFLVFLLYKHWMMPQI